MRHPLAFRPPERSGNPLWFETSSRRANKGWREIHSPDQTIPSGYAVTPAMTRGNGLRAQSRHEEAFSTFENDAVILAGSDGSEVHTVEQRGTEGCGSRESRSPRAGCE